MKTFKQFDEGLLDLLTKKGREKQAKVSRRLAGVRKTQKSRQDEIKRMDSLMMKFASPRGGSDEEKKELAKLKSKYSDLIKKRQDKMNKKPQQGG